MAHLKTIDKVLVLMAMEQEARPFIEKHGFKPVPIPAAPATVPFKAYCGNISNSGAEVVLVWAGSDSRFVGNNVGTTASTASAYASILGFQPDLVLSAGTAGGFSSTSIIGDVWLSTKCVFHSRRIPLGSTYEEYGIGHFRSPPLPLLASKCGLKQGVVSTSDSLDHTATDLQFMRSEGAQVKEMEAAAIAWVCQILGVPFIALKSITDLIDSEHTTREEFERNLGMASEKISEKLTLLLSEIGGTDLSSWRGDGASVNHSKL